MTSGNVSNLLALGQGQQMEQSIPRQEVSKNNIFDMTLRDIAGSRTATSPEISTNEKVEKSEPREFVSTNKKIETTSADSQKVENENKDLSEIEEKIEAFSDSVKETIAEELDVSVEEIEKAMENLGLTVIDLIDPKNLAQLVLNLTEQGDSFNLIVSDEFKNILDDVLGLAGQLLESEGVSFQEIKEFMISFTDKDINVVEPPVENVDLKNILPEEMPVMENPEMVQKQVEKNDLEIVNKDSNPILSEEISKETKVVATAEEVSEEDVDLTPIKTGVENESNGEAKSDSEFVPNKDAQRAFLKENNIAQNIHSETMVFAQKIDVTFSQITQTVSLPTGETVSAQNIVNQFIEQAKIINSAEFTTMEMTLNPEGLGKIFMEVTQKGDEIVAKLFTENEAVKAALENQMASLKAELNQSSQKITSIEVSVATHEFERNLDEQAQDQPKDETQKNNPSKRHSHIDLNNLDDLAGVMTEEEELVAQIMRDNGNTLNFQA